MTQEQEKIVAQVKEFLESEEGRRRMAAARERAAKANKEFHEGLRLDPMLLKIPFDICGEIVLKLIRSKSFNNGTVYAMETEDGYPIEVTDTFLPYYTKNAVGRQKNSLLSDEVGSRLDRWMIGVSCMSGCPIGCKFCATGNLKRCRLLRKEEIVDQVNFVLAQNQGLDPDKSKEFKINYTRMGEPFLNLDAVQGAIDALTGVSPKTHHYISTIGLKGSDFSWINGNITLQISLHSFDEDRRDDLIPVHNKMSIEELGQIRTASKLKTTVNLTLVDESDFDIEKLRRYFDPEHFFIKLSPINPNEISETNGLGLGVIEAINLA